MFSGSEPLTIGNALLIALSGFLVVFLMLILLWGILAVVNKVVSSIEGKAAQPVPVPAPTVNKAPVSEPAETKKEPQTYGGEIALYDVDEKTAACIMAIISDETKIPLDQLIFKSIKAVA